jgi:hypothetical protein
MECVDPLFLRSVGRASGPVHYAFLALVVLNHHERQEGVVHRPARPADRAQEERIDAFHHQRPVGDRDFYLISLAGGVLLISARGSSIDLLHILFGTVLALGAGRADRRIPSPAAGRRPRGR